MKLADCFAEVPTRGNGLADSYHGKTTGTMPFFDRMCGFPTQGARGHPFTKPACLFALFSILNLSTHDRNQEHILKQVRLLGMLPGLARMYRVAVRALLPFATQTGQLP